MAAAFLAAAVLVLAPACAAGESAPRESAPVESTAGSPPRTVRYLPLGDSITAGEGLPGAYRTTLWQDLVQRDQDRIDFVGSKTGEGPAALGDQDHEGHSGWCIAGQCRQQGRDSMVAAVPGWLQASRPDIVSIHLGTNDITLGASGQETAERLDQLVGVVYATDPDVVVVLIQIIPIARHTQQHDEYDALIPAVAAKYQAQGRRVSVADLSRLLTYPRDYRDGAHPTQAGFDQMGHALAPAISAAYRELA